MFKKIKLQVSNIEVKLIIILMCHGCKYAW